MPRRSWNGRRVTAAVRWVIARDRGICWLCGHPGADSLDHVIPVKLRPDLEWEPSNWKAAHLNARPEYGCQGNRRKGFKLITQEPTREW